MYTETDAGLKLHDKQDKASSLLLTLHFDTSLSIRLCLSQHLYLIHYVYLQKGPEAMDEGAMFQSGECEYANCV